MQAMIDHTAAVVIGATILFILFALSTRSNDSSIEATQVDITRTELRTLVDVIEQDFNNMGSGMGDPNVSATERVVRSRGTVGGYETVTFLATPNDTGSPSPVLVTYRWKQDGTAVLPDGTVVDVYEVEREIGGQTATFENATNINVTMRYETLLPVSSAAYANSDSLAAVRYLDVDVGMVSPVGTEDLIQQARWKKRFRPLNLEPNTRRIVASPPVAPPAPPPPPPSP